MTTHTPIATLLPRRAHLGRGPHKHNNKQYGGRNHTRNFTTLRSASKNIILIILTALLYAIVSSCDSILFLDEIITVRIIIYYYQKKERTMRR